MEPIPPCQIYVDQEGVWYHLGRELIHRPLLLYLMSCLRRDPSSGIYFLVQGENRCTLEAEDTPLVVTRVDRENTRDTEEILLTLSDETRESLDPGRLWVGENHILYTVIKKGTMPARFLRKSYYQMAGYLAEDALTGEFYLSLNGRKNFLRHTPPAL